MTGTVDVHCLDAEFNLYLQVARGLMQKMKLADDRRVSEKYIRSCLSMEHSDQLKVKFHRNRFFRYLLKTMQRTVQTKGLHFVNLPDGQEMKDGQSTTQWSADRKSYVSAKIIPGFGTLVYMACTDNPDLGWDENGFANFIDISDVPNVATMQQPEEEPAQAENH